MKPIKQKTPIPTTKKLKKVRSDLSKTKRTKMRVRCWYSCLTENKKNPHIYLQTPNLRCNLIIATTEKHLTNTRVIDDMGRALYKKQ